MKNLKPWLEAVRMEIIMRRDAAVFSNHQNGQCCKQCLPDERISSGIGIRTLIFFAQTAIIPKSLEMYPSG